MESANKCPSYEKRVEMRAYVRIKFKENMKLGDSRAIEAAIKVGQDELANMEYYHSVRENKLKEAFRKSNANLTPTEKSIEGGPVLEASGYILPQDGDKTSETTTFIETHHVLDKVQDEEFPTEVAYNPHTKSDDVDHVERPRELEVSQEFSTDVILDLLDIKDDKRNQGMVRKHRFVVPDEKAVGEIGNAFNRSVRLRELKDLLARQQELVRGNFPTTPSYLKDIHTEMPSREKGYHLEEQDNSHHFRNETINVLDQDEEIDHEDAHEAYTQVSRRLQGSEFESVVFEVSSDESETDTPVEEDDLLVDSVETVSSLGGKNDIFSIVSPYSFTGAPNFSDSIGFSPEELRSLRAEVALWKLRKSFASCDFDSFRVFDKKKIRELTDHQLRLSLALDEVEQILQKARSEIAEVLEEVQDSAKVLSDSLAEATATQSSNEDGAVKSDAVRTQAFDSPSSPDLRKSVVNYINCISETPGRE